MIDLLKNPQTLFLAIIGGAGPAILWLWFWFKEEDDERSDPVGLIILYFLLGAIVVLLAIWIEKASISIITDKNLQIIAWATIEEILKLLAVSAILIGSHTIKKPLDYPMYFIACALGFAALENVLYLLRPIDVSGTIVGMFTGNLRYLGSTLLHAISSGMIGSALGLSFYMQKSRLFYIFVGTLCAIVLHSVFNFFIMKGTGENFLSVFGFLWVVAIINIIIFEKLKRMGKSDNFQQS
jgi:RsiW-degrading membrane proteinase PrsW (M82 family)